MEETEKKLFHEKELEKFLFLRVYHEDLTNELHFQLENYSPKHYLVYPFKFNILENLFGLYNSNQATYLSTYSRKTIHRYRITKDIRNVKFNYSIPRIHSTNVTVEKKPFEKFNCVIMAVFWGDIGKILLVCRNDSNQEVKVILRFTDLVNVNIEGTSHQNKIVQSNSAECLIHLSIPNINGHWKYTYDAQFSLVLDGKVYKKRIVQDGIHLYEIFNKDGTVSIELENHSISMKIFQEMVWIDVENYEILYESSRFIISPYSLRRMKIAKLKRKDETSEHNFDYNIRVLDSEKIECYRSKNIFLNSWYFEAKDIVIIESYNPSIFTYEFWLNFTILENARVSVWQGYSEEKRACISASRRCLNYCYISPDPPGSSFNYKYICFLQKVQNLKELERAIQKWSFLRQNMPIPSSEDCLPSEEEGSRRSSILRSPSSQQTKKKNYLLQPIQSLLKITRNNNRNKMKEENDQKLRREKEKLKMKHKKEKLRNRKKKKRGDNNDEEEVEGEDDDEDMVSSSEEEEGERFIARYEDLDLQFQKVDLPPISQQRGLNTVDDEKVSPCALIVIKDKKLFIDKEFPPCQESIYPEWWDDERIERGWVQAGMFLGRNYKVFYEGIEPDDILQGDVGNCWFLSSVACLAKIPRYIKKLFVTEEVNEAGLYELQFCISGKWTRVVIDSFFPVIKSTRHPLFCRNHGQELWAMLIEKAYAKLNGGYLALHLGNAKDSMRDLTGCPTRIKKLKRSEYRRQFYEIRDFLERGYLLTALTKENINPDSSGLIRSHYYTVCEVQEFEDLRMIKLRNPWGYHEWLGDYSDKSPKWTPHLKAVFGYVDKDDGKFWMTIKDFLKFFLQYCVCKCDREWIEKRCMMKVKSGRFDKSLWVRVVRNKTRFIAGVHQEDKRRVKNFKKYVGVGLKIIRKKKKGFFKSQVTGTRLVRTNSLDSEEVLLDKGIYEIVVVLYEKNTTADLIISTHSDRNIDLFMEKK